MKSTSSVVVSPVAELAKSIIGSQQNEIDPMTSILSSR